MKIVQQLLEQTWNDPKSESSNPPTDVGKKFKIFMPNYTFHL